MISANINTRAGLGWANLGGYACSEAPSRDLQRSVFNTAHAAGIRLHDTAVDYGRGYAEEGLACAIEQGEIHRHELRIHSKVLRKIVRDSSLAYREPGLWRCPEPYQSWSTTWDWSYEGVLRQAAESRERLQIAYHDGLALHDPAEAVREGGLNLKELETSTLAALRDLKHQGLLKEIGMGSKEVPAALDLLRLYPGVFDYAMIMNYNLLDHADAIERLIPECQEQNVGVFLAGPYASGILAQPLNAVSGTFYYRTAPAEIDGKLRAIRDLARDQGLTSLKAIAIQFAAANRSINKIIFGGRSPAEIEENVRNLTTPVSTDFWKSLRELTVAGEPVLHPKAPLPGGI